VDSKGARARYYAERIGCLGGLVLNALAPVNLALSRFTVGRNIDNLLHGSM
jgi:hypothetical protein